MQVLDPKLLESHLRSRIEADMAAGIISGSAALIRQNGEIVCEEYFGTTVPGGNVPVCENTIFRLASMTKPITAAAALLLVSRGLLNLEDPIEKYLPSYSNMRLVTLDAAGNLTDNGPADRKITVLHLLTHTSGIGSDVVGEKQHAQMPAAANRTLASAVDYFSTQGLAFEPFTTQAYSGLAAFDVIARIIEVITGEDYQSFLRRELFLPCDMKDTTFLPTPEQAGRMITMHNLLNGQSCVGETFENCNFWAVPNTHFLG